MAKNYNVTLTDKYEAKVINSSSKDCLFDEQKYDLYYDKVKGVTKNIVSNCDNIIKLMDKVLSDSQTGKAPASYCKRVKQNAEKIKAELIESRNNLGVKLDCEFKRQIKAWIAWSKKREKALMQEIENLQNK